MWTRFWFCPTKPELLGFGRALVCGVLLLDALLHPFSIWADMAEVFYTPTFPNSFFGVPSYNVCQVIEFVWKCALLGATVGFYTRMNMFVSAFLGTYVLSLPLNYYGFGYPGSHHYHAIVIILWILALSRCGDAFSVDARIVEREKVPNGDYTWPVRLVWVTLSCMFFAAALTKLRVSGWAWISAENFRLSLLNRYYFKSADPLTDWGLWASQNATLCYSLALMTLVFELTYPLGMVAGFRPNSNWRWMVLIPGAMVASIIVIWFLMGHNFWLVVVAHVFWWPQKVYPEEGSSPPKGKALALCAFLVIALGSAADTLLLREHFPFSCYSMYSTIKRHEVHSRYLLYGVDEFGEERMLQAREPAPAGNASLNRSFLHRAWKALKDDPDRLQLGLRDCLRRYNDLGFQVVSLRLYECRWTLDHKLTKLHDPDRTLISEYKPER